MIICLLDISNLLLIQWGKTTTNGYKMITLPTTYTNSYIGLTTTNRNAGASADEGGNGFSVSSLTTCSVSPCSFKYTLFWFTIGF